MVKAKMRNELDKQLVRKSSKIIHNAFENYQTGTDIFLLASHYLLDLLSPKRQP